MKIRVAVVGLGYWGPKHARVLGTIPDVAEVVLVDPAARPDRGVAPGAQLLPSLDAALPFIDAAVIATPARTHTALALEAIRAGKHVLVEKPMATSVDDAQELICAAERAGVVLMVGHTYAYDASIQQLRSIIRQGHLGELHYLDSSRLNLGLYRPDVSVVWDLAVHDLAIMNYLLDSAPDTVAARCGHSADERFEDIAYIWLEYHAVNAVAAIHASWIDPRKVRQLTVVGSERMAVFDDVAVDERLKIYDRGVDVVAEAEVTRSQHDVTLSYRYGDVVAPYVPPKEPLLAEDCDFVECILTGRQPVADGRSGLAVVEGLVAVDESLRTNRLVDVASVRSERTSA